MSGRGADRHLGREEPVDWLTPADTLLDHAAREGATEAEAVVMAESSALTRFANSEIHQNVAEAGVSINLRVAIGRRVGNHSRTF